MQKKLVKKFEIAPEVLAQAVSQAMGGAVPLDVGKLYEESVKDFKENTVVTGKILKILNNEVLVDVGYKSEGVVPAYEFGEDAIIEPGQEIEVLIEEIENTTGFLVLSKRKADRIRGWEKVISTHAEGDVVKGTVVRKIKGGLLVDIGVPVFLPASQVSLRRTGDIADFIGKEIECKIIKIDESRMNIVVSRRKLIEEQREKLRTDLLATLKEGQTRHGVVKNIADFGAFVDLGGIDGLLHITDMTWGRISHPSELLAIDQEIDVMVLKFDKERNRIALGMKQLQESPWASVDAKYPVGSAHVGEVVNLMPYGAFVKLEDGIEGLVHISEMSWTRRVNHPSEIVQPGDRVEVKVLDINREKQEISLGMKQCEVNPWTTVEERYPVGTVIEGTVRNLTNYGAFIEIEEGIDGLLHVSDMSWTKKIGHPNEMLKKGDTVQSVVLSVDREKKRVALGLKQLEPDPWKDEIPRKYGVGDVVAGQVMKIANFGVFVALEDGLEGLLHISELSRSKVSAAEDVVKAGQKVNVRILKVDIDERKIGLSMIGVEQPPREEALAGVVESAPPDASPAAEVPPAGEAGAAPAESTQSPGAAVE
ncbi:MAG: 30S ribosomal protein S1 [Planctomycetes bacterium]|nr:30S ribosomal protein S1 [Planctomycetota bacterium]